MFKYKLTIQYNGTNYHGWQRQENAKTIQQELEVAFTTVLREKISLIAAGRTDTGVHAIGQVAHFTSEQKIDIYKIHFAVNSILPKDIYVYNFELVDINFHARFDAVKRSYYYLITTKRSPFFQNFAFHYFYSVDIKELNELSNVLMGEFDFSSFSKNINEQENTICIVHDIHWYKRGDIIYFLIEANRYLHGMVRSIVGTILEIAKENRNEEELKRILLSKDRKNAGQSVPPHGLYLYKVKY